MHFLYITEFLTGMSVMAAELGAQRFLAPYFSSSQIVWTIIIGMIMISMSIGNVIGGRMADKDPNPKRLYFLLGVAGVWLGITPIFGKYVVALSSLIAAILPFSFLISASVISCILLFVPPQILMGMTTPSLMKYAIKDLNDTGKITGKLEALQTIGSIIGTFIPTFFTIPLFGTKMTFIIFGLIMTSLSLIYFAKRGSYKINIILILIVIIAGFLCQNISYSFSMEDVVYEDESMYNYLRVDENEEEVILSTHIFFGVQSIWKKNEAFTGMYYDVAFLAPFLSEEFNNALILGNGTGTYAKILKEHFPKSDIVGVEIDKKINDLAYKYFDMPKDIDIIVGDGRWSLKNIGTFDVIMLDTYRDITIPFELSTVEFFREIKSHLSPNGVVVINMNLSGEINEYLLDTIGHEFKYIYTAKSQGNIEAFATDYEGAMDNYKKAKDLEFFKEIELKEAKTGDKILTDDKAPVEILGMRALDEIVKRELERYRGKNILDLLKE